MTSLRHALPTLLLVAAAPLGAQERVPQTLTLDDALEIARGNNPGFQQTRNDERLADWDVRQAWAQAYLPTATASSGVSWQGAGEQRFGSLTLGDLGFANQPSYYFSNYNINLGYSVSWAQLKAPSQARAQRGATMANIRVAEASLVSQVTNAYIEMLRQEEALRLTRQQLENGEFNLRLAEGQLEVGQVTPIDVGQAEIQVGRSQVAVLQAENARETARMRLLQQMGLPVDQSFGLATTFEISEPTWEVDELVERALAANPTLESSRRSKEAADIGVSSAKSPYLPTLSINTGWSGFTRQASNTDFQVAQAQAQVAGSIAQCQSTNDLYSRLADPLPPLNCSRFVFTDAQRRSIEQENSAFPFSFDQQPPQVSFGISIPIFQGLSRQRNLEAARLQQDDLGHQLRERYQLGAITFVDLVEAQTLLAQAERDRLNAVFAYHDLVTTLETLVGASLRN